MAGLLAGRRTLDGTGQQDERVLEGPISQGRRSGVDARTRVPPMREATRRRARPGDGRRRLEAAGWGKGWTRDAHWPKAYGGRPGLGRAQAQWCMAEEGWGGPRARPNPIGGTTLTGDDSCRSRPLLGKIRRQRIRCGNPHPRRSSKASCGPWWQGVIRTRAAGSDLAGLQTKGRRHGRPLARELERQQDMDERRRIWPRWWLLPGGGPGRVEKKA